MLATLGDQHHIYSLVEIVSSMLTWRDLWVTQLNSVHGYEQFIMLEG